MPSVLEPLAAMRFCPCYLLDLRGMPCDPYWNDSRAADGYVFFIAIDSLTFLLPPMCFEVVVMFLS